MSAASQGSTKHLPSLTSSYRPFAGTPDEMVDGDGNVRPVWWPLMRYMESLPAGELLKRFDRGNRYLNDAGVYYRHYGKGDVGSRNWPLSHIPVILSDVEWQELSAGLIQRAELLEAVMADIYGDNALLRSGDLPGSLLAGNPHWLRPLVGVKPASGHYLHFIAMELGRGADGRWWVLGDRTEAPSGAGFALETRVATSRVFSEIYRDANVRRLAGFFGAFKTALEQLGGQRPGSAGLLTPGQFNETYYEQAYIARYLGIALLEGEDLMVEGQDLMVRTIAGPQPISVLWRRLESAWADPLELDERSHLGAAGLVEAVRSGRLDMVNALGAGVLETQAFLAFLPRLSQRLFGKPLAIPNVATWWCGQEAEFNYVRANSDRLVISPVTSNRLPLERDRLETASQSLIPEGMTRDQWLERDRQTLVGQETLNLSTTPVWQEGQLVPRPMTLRVFLARTPAGWKVMPGGFARVARGASAGGIAMRHGSSVADVWVVANHPVPEETLLKREGAAFLRAHSGVLPSRAADNLFWLGRYVERTEGALRLLRAYHARLAETGDRRSPLLKRIERLFDTNRIDIDDPIPVGIVASINSAIFSAGKIRDRFSLDGWSALVDLQTSVQQLSQTVTAGDDAARAASVLIRKLTGFSGLVNDNMYRALGWRFLSIGQALERAIGMMQLVADLTAPDAPDGALDVAIEVGDSVMTHRRRYSLVVKESIFDLLVLDALNPRSVLFELERLLEHARFLPGTADGERHTSVTRALVGLHADIVTNAPETMSRDWLISTGGRIAALSSLITDTYFA